MKKKGICLGLLLMFLLAIGCMAQTAAADSQSCANVIAEKMLTGLKEDNYAKFSEDFDQQMSNSLPAAEFAKISREIKGKIGDYIAKEFVSSEQKEQYSIFTYKAKFSQEVTDVVVRIVLTEADSKFLVSGFWLDSPNLRQ
ncbi:MAG TPA: DUF3887 domain-containing protein [Methylomusa anaerophila]|uniref:DUF3887 domain-containing protein n=1 Tax=Methylomusa anaerophila TaxID=1930071 RepID=A0A348AL80_9FIRM|nr:DUF3887 domain-containing protein [Methylomusa anaerophila]BBB91828.1 hypothetical protein MAMMFC1_02513 [Methylomusa anaerophila]HML88439.1 DUF3887 domain-containing protein [Methylomusa anaerophila]